MTSGLLRAASAAFLLFASALPIGAAVSTTPYTLSNNSWTDLGAGPLVVQTLGDTAQVAVSDSSPSLSDRAFILYSVGVGNAPTNFNTTSHIWAKAFNNTTTLVAAPIAASGGGGSSVVAGTQEQDVTESRTLNGASTSSQQTYTLNGQSTFSFSFTGLAASGATVSFFQSNDWNGTTGTFTGISEVNTGTGVPSLTRSTDGQSAIGIEGTKAIRVQVTTAGTGTITLATNISVRSRYQALRAPLPPGGNLIGGVTLYQAGSVLSVGNPLFAQITNTVSVSGSVNANNFVNGAAVTAANPLPVTPPDGKTIAVGPGSAVGPLTGPDTNATTGAFSTVGYQSISVNMGSLGVGTVQVNSSLDGTTWGLNADCRAENNPGAGTTSASLLTAGLTYRCPAYGNFARINVAAYTSGSPAGTVVLKYLPVTQGPTYNTQGPNIAGSTAGWLQISQAAANPGGITLNARLPSSAASTNLTAIKTGAGRLFKVTGYNTNAAPRRLKCYNVASGSVTVGTTTIDFTRTLPPGPFSFDWVDIGRSFSTALSCALTVNPADNDTTAVGAGDITDLNFEYQ